MIIKVWFFTETDGFAKYLDTVRNDTFWSWDVDEEEENDDEEKEEKEEKGNDGATLKNDNFLDREPGGRDITDEEEEKEDAVVMCDDEEVKLNWAETLEDVIFVIRKPEDGVEEKGTVLDEEEEEKEEEKIGDGRSESDIVDDGELVDEFTADDTSDDEVGTFNGPIKKKKATYFIKFRSIKKIDSI